jgi:hypothetical protein
MRSASPTPDISHVLPHKGKPLHLINTCFGDVRVELLMVLLYIDILPGTIFDKVVAFLRLRHFPSTSVNVTSWKMYSWLNIVLQDSSTFFTVHRLEPYGELVMFLPGHPSIS